VVGAVAHGEDDNRVHDHGGAVEAVGGVHLRERRSRESGTDPLGPLAVEPQRCDAFELAARAFDMTSVVRADLEGVEGVDEESREAELQATDAGGDDALGHE
jgi:hypothetical protein